MTCQKCEWPTLPDQTVCPQCIHELRTTLDHAPDTLATAEVTIRRQDQVTRSNGGGGGGDPRTLSPVNLAASEHAHTLRHALQAWAARVRETEAETDPDAAAGMATVEPAAYLRMSLTLIAGQDYAGTLCEDITRAHRRLVNAIDLPPEHVNLGPCVTPDCPGTIRGTMTNRNGKRALSPRAECRTCHAVYDAPMLNAYRVGGAWGYWCPLPDAVAVLRSIPGTASRATLYRWARKGMFWRTVGTPDDLYCPAQMYAAIQARKLTTTPM